MTTTELDTTIAGVEATLSATEQAHARQVRALQQELAALTAQRWRVRPSMPPRRFDTLLSAALFHH
jgi:hypothetical protein